MTDHIFMTEVVQPVLIKDGGLFLASDADGEVRVTCGSGLGLFHHDARYLSRYELRIGNRPCLTLMSSAARGDEAVHELTNDKALQLDGSELKIQSLGLRLERAVDGEARTLTDRVVVSNYAGAPVSFRLSMLVDALFEDIFELRGSTAGRRGPARTVKCDSRTLRFNYCGADGVSRSLTAAFSRPPDFGHRRGARVATYDITLPAQGAECLEVVFTVREVCGPAIAAPPRPEFYDGVRIESDDAVLDTAVHRSLRDLAMLRTGLDSSFIAGGMPWFVAPFGRDSLLAAVQTLVFDPRPAEGVARLFALHQGRADDAETGEAPGKIPHELRLGEMARLKEVPHRPSYLSVDSTPLFLILIGRHVEWSGDPSLFLELRAAVDAAVAWVERQIGDDVHGYLSYRGDTKDGPVNQGWKDSVLGVPRRDGRPPKSPIALCEVQGYAYLAYGLIAAALRQVGEADEAARLDRLAEALRLRFNRDFWMEREGCYALALERGGRQVDVVTSNAGQVLWSGIADRDKAVRTATRLSARDMDSGWGIRTLSDREVRYNPLNYHLGSVWPFDTSLIVAGLRRYGLDDMAVKLVDDMLDAAACFALGRLPEFYVGLQREADLFPARCPFAEPMQAWSAGAVPYMLVSLLGLQRGRDGVELERPVLPKRVRRLALRGLSSGSTRFDCDVTVDAAGEVRAAVKPGTAA